MTKTVKIGELFPLLAAMEAAKGRAKLAQAQIEGAKAPFIAAADGENVVFVSETGQKLASVSQESRDTVTVARLLELGVSKEVVLAATRTTAFAVLRVH